MSKSKSDKYLPFYCIDCGEEFDTLRELEAHECKDE